MAARFGIYGFAITKPIPLSQATIWPILDDLNDSYERARNKSEYFLTAVGTADASLSEPQLRQMLFDLQATLTFCQQQPVRIPIFKSLLTTHRPSRSKPGFARSLPNYCGARRTGTLIGEDRIFGSSRKEFVALCMQRLADAQFCERTGLREALFYSTHALEASNKYVQIDYYLHFSALEMLARRICQDAQSPAPEVLTKFLRDQCGLAVVQDDGTGSKRSAVNYCKMRNSLYHEGKLTTTVTEGGKPMVVPITNYLYSVRSLLRLGILRVIGFDDGHINWNQWLDRQPFR